MIPINDIELMEKLIVFQSCMIEGKTLKSIFHLNREFLLNRSNADVIALYFNEHGRVRPKYILEKERDFTHLITKHLFSKKNFPWETFSQQCHTHFHSGIQYREITHLYQIFQGYMTQKEANEINTKLNIHTIVLFPIFDFTHREIIGYCSFIFRSTDTPDIHKLQSIHEMIQTLIRPLYDKEHHTIYTKCIRIDEEMSFLTNKEKHIVKKIISGLSYEEIATLSHISINTLKSHIKNIFSKYGVNSKIELFQKLHVYN